MHCLRAYSPLYCILNGGYDVIGGVRGGKGNRYCIGHMVIEGVCGCGCGWVSSQLMTHEKSFSVSVMSLHPFSLSNAIEGSASCDPHIGSNVLLWRGRVVVETPGTGRVVVETPGTGRVGVETPDTGRGGGGTPGTGPSLKR